jgi:zinc transporter 1/2/3
MAPTGEVQILAAQAAQTTAAPTTTSSITALSDCHLHETQL